MNCRPYVVVVELSGGRHDGRVEVSVVDAFDVLEAVQQATMEAIGRYGANSVNPVLCSPATQRALDKAVNMAKDLPLMRMTPLGGIA